MSKIPSLPGDIRLKIAQMAHRAWFNNRSTYKKINLKAGEMHGNFMMRINLGLVFPYRTMNGDRLMEPTSYMKTYI